MKLIGIDDTGNPKTPYELVVEDADGDEEARAPMTRDQMRSLATNLTLVLEMDHRHEGVS